MSIELLIDQQPAGTFTVSRDGLYTVFEAAAPKATGLVRLWVHGGGKSAYLGLMQPTQEGFVLRRRLSRRELAAFPEPIEAVSDSEQEQHTEDLHKEVDIKEEPPEAAPEESAAISGEEGASAAEADGLHKTETDYSACPWPAEAPEEGLLWYSRGDGSLTAFDGVSSLLALPAELRAPDAHTAERVIEGKKYLVFRY